jgi:hypothetical protein
MTHRPPSKEVGRNASAHWRLRGARFPRIIASTMTILAPQCRIGLKRAGASGELVSSTCASIVDALRPVTNVTSRRIAALKSAISSATDRAPCPCDNPTGVSVPSVLELSRRQGSSCCVLLRSSSEAPRSRLPRTRPNERRLSIVFHAPGTATVVSQSRLWYWP